MLVVAALDDPIVPAESLPVASFRSSPLVTFEPSGTGGHVGFVFVEGPPWRIGSRAEKRVARWIAEELLGETRP